MASKRPACHISQLRTVKNFSSMFLYFNGISESIFLSGIPSCNCVNGSFQAASVRWASTGSEEAVVWCYQELLICCCSLWSTCSRNRVRDVCFIRVLPKHCFGGAVKSKSLRGINKIFLLRIISSQHVSLPSCLLFIVFVTDKLHLCVF